MPPLVKPRDYEVDMYNVDKDQYRKKYPNGLDLRPDSEDHKKILDMVMSRAIVAHSEIKKRFNSWNEIDRTLTAFVRPSEKEQKVKDEDEKKPVAVVIPLSYAALETALTYYTSVFIDQPFMYDAVESSDIIKAAMLEHLINRQVAQGRMGLGLHTQFRDAFAYGFGLGGPEWVKEFAYRTDRKPTGKWSNLLRQFVNMPLRSGRRAGAVPAA